ncbi:hypothetical protein H6768_00980 [Candidatus Peribacteria bacterium]|nr:hypothetical protein [Candidatus Peribacteria bacterium]
MQDGSIQPLSQNPEEATYTKMIEKKDGELQSTWTIEEAYHRWQAYTPWPGLFTQYHDMRVILTHVEIIPEGHMRASGTWILYEGLPAIILTN